MTKQLPEVASRKTSNFSRSVLLSLAASVVLLLGSIAFALSWTAGQHDQLAERNTELMIESAVESLKDRTETLAFDYAFWDPYYEAVISNDDEWLYPNVGSGAIEGTAIEMIVQILPGHESNQGWDHLHEDEAPTPGLLDEEIAQRVNATLDATPSTSQDVFSYFEVIDGQVWLLAVSRITPYEGISPDIPDIEIPRQVMGVRLSEEVLDRLGVRYLLKDIDLSRDAPVFNSALELKNFPGTRSRICPGSHRRPVPRS